VSAPPAVLFRAPRLTSLAVCAALCAGQALGRAQGQTDTAPLDKTQVLYELESVEKKHRQLQQSEREQQIKRLHDALANESATTSLYEDAVAATTPGEKGDKSRPRKNSPDLLRMDSMRKAIKLHLRYLVLSLQRGNDPDQAAHLAAPSLEYATELLAVLTDEKLRPLPREAKDLLNKPLSDGVFAHWLLLQDNLPNEDAWEPTAGELAGILEKNVRAPWRAAKNPNLLRTWDLQAAFLNAKADLDPSPAENEKIKTLSLPRLQFARAEDKALLGQPNQAAREILQLAKSSPGHPDWDKWTARLHELIGATAQTDK